MAAYLAVQAGSHAWPSPLPYGTSPRRNKAHRPRFYRNSRQTHQPASPDRHSARLHCGPRLTRYFSPAPLPGPDGCRWSRQPLHPAAWRRFASSCRRERRISRAPGRPASDRAARPAPSRSAPECSTALRDNAGASPAGLHPQILPSPSRREEQRLDNKTPFPPKESDAARSATASRTPRGTASRCSRVSRITALRRMKPKKAGKSASSNRSICCKNTAGRSRPVMFRSTRFRQCGHPDRPSGAAYRLWSRPGCRMIPIVLRIR